MHPNSALLDRPPSADLRPTALGTCSLSPCASAATRLALLPHVHTPRVHITHYTHHMAHTTHLHTPHVAQQAHSSIHAHVPPPHRHSLAHMFTHQRPALPPLQLLASTALLQHSSADIQHPLLLLLAAATAHGQDVGRAGDLADHIASATDAFADSPPALQLRTAVAFCHLAHAPAAASAARHTGIPAIVHLLRVPETAAQAAEALAQVAEACRDPAAVMVQAVLSEALVQGLLPAMQALLAPAAKDARLMLALVRLTSEQRCWLLLPMICDLLFVLSVATARHGAVIYPLHAAVHVARQHITCFCPDLYHLSHAVRLVPLSKCCTCTAPCSRLHQAPAAHAKPHHVPSSHPPTLPAPCRRAEQLRRHGPGPQAARGPAQAAAGGCVQLRAASF
jgi:hypothetical protein